MSALSTKAIAKLDLTPFSGLGSWNQTVAHRNWSDAELATLKYELPTPVLNIDYERVIRWSSQGTVESPVQGLVYLLAKVALNLVDVDKEKICKPEYEPVGALVVPEPDFSQDAYAFLNAPVVNDTVQQSLNGLVASQGAPFVSAYLSYACLGLFRCAVKREETMNHVFSTLNRSFSSLTGITVNVPPLFGQDVLKSLCTYMKERPPIVNGVLFTALNAWMTTQKRDAKARLSASLVIALTYYGLPIVSLARRATLALNTSIAAIFKETYGTPMDVTFRSLLTLQAIYMLTGPERSSWLDKLGVTGFPVEGQKWWMFSRVFVPDVMAGYGGSMHDTALLFFIKVHDICKPADAIEKNYRRITPSLNVAHLDQLAKVVCERFTSLANTEEDVGPSVKMTKKQLNVEGEATVSSQATSNKRLHVDITNTASTVTDTGDDDLEEM